MNIQKLTLVLITLALLLVFTSCSSEERIGNSESLFTAKINGELFEATKLSQSSILEIPGYGYRFDIAAENDKYRIIFLITHKNGGDCMPTGTYDNFENDTEVLMDFYYRVEGTNSFVSVYFPLEDSNGVVQQEAMVNFCEDKKLSGTFSGKMYNIDDSGDSIYPENIDITEGKFQNIKYILLNQ